MTPKTTTIRISKEMQRRLSRVAKNKTPRTSANALAIHYVDTGLERDESASVRQSKEVQ